MDSSSKKPLFSALGALKGLGSAPDRPDRSPPAAPKAPPSPAPALSALGMSLTDEQEAVWACEAQRVKVRAYAGTGKTTLLLAIAKKRADKGLYIAFNKSIAQEARAKFPEHIHCATSHSVALGALRRLDARWGERLKDKIGPCSAERAARVLRQRLSEAEAAGPMPKLALETVLRFVVSAESRVSQTHIPPGSLRLAGGDRSSIDPQRVVSLALDLWRAMSDPSNLEAPISHDGYLKKWSLTSKPFSSGLVLLDEAQDSNPALLNAITQSEARQVYVGDEHQAIYGFRGAENALESIHWASSFPLTRSFRFGPELASLASSLILLKGGDRPLLGQGAHTAILKGSAPLGAKALYLARSNAGLFQKALQTAAAGKTVCFLGGGGVTLSGVSDLLALRRGDRPQDPYLQSFRSLEELQAVASEMMDMELLLKCSLAEEYGDRLPEALAKINAKTVSDPERAHLALSTVHKAKGMEFDWVELANDFALPELRSQRAGWIAKEDFEEANILYVALTRARKGLALREDHQWRWFERAQKLMREPSASGAPQDIQEAARAFLALSGPLKGSGPLEAEESLF